MGENVPCEARGAVDKEGQWPLGRGGGSDSDGGSDSGGGGHGELCVFVRVDWTRG